MADNNIKFIINVDDSGSKATIRDINGQILKTNVSVKDLNVAIKDVSKTLGLNDNALSSNAKYHENSERAIRSEINSLQSLRSNLDVNSKGYISLGNRISLLQQKLKTTSNGVSGLTRAQTQLKNSSGAATSAAMELGRVVSDAPYGIRGMANNITQLVSSLGYQAAATNTATGAAYGYAGALKAMWAAMTGPLGIVLAITAVVSALDMLYGANEKAETSTSDLKSEFEDFADVLRNDVNASVEEYIKLINEKNRVEKLVNDSSERYLEIEEEIANAQKNRAIQEEYQAKFRKIHGKESEETSKRIIELTERETNLLKEREQLFLDTGNAINDLKKKTEEYKNVTEGEKEDEVIEGSLKHLKQILSVQKKNRDAQSLTNSTYKELTAIIEGIEKKIEEIEGKGKKNKSKFSLFKTKEELDLAVKDQETALLNLSKKVEQQNLKNKEKEELLGAKTEAEKNKIKRKYAEQQLELNISYEKKKLVMSKSTERQVAKIKHDEHIETLKRTLAEYKQKVKLNDKLSDSQKEDLIGKAKTETDKLIAQAGSELIKTNEGIDEAYEPVFKLFEELAKKRREALGIFEEGSENGSKENENLANHLETYKALVSGINDFIDGEYSRQLTIEENHTNKLNEQLNNRLLNEKLSASEREKIQNQIALNDEALRKKQNEIKKKQFNTNKAYNIAMGITNTVAAALAAAAQDWGGPIKRIAGMAAVITTGLANVAMIARQKFQPDAASTPIATTGGGGSGSGGVGNRSFDFNLVGNNQNNQLADVIGSQFNQPLKAYVVSKDITNAQQLDANTKSAARFGD